MQIVDLMRRHRTHGQGADGDLSTAIGSHRLASQLRNNERIWNGFRQIELHIIGAHSLADIMATLSRDLPALFPHVDRVTIACVDPEMELSRLLEPTDPAPETPFIPISPDVLRTLFPFPNRPRLGGMDDAVRQLLFPGDRLPLASMALAPLILRGELIGCLNQGSRDAAHFSPGTGTDLLEHLAAVTAMCLDNAVIRERLKIDGLTDPLTGLYNRRFFERRMGEEMERWARRRDGALTCMLVDVDHFKQINDRHGHQAGDRVLQGLARLLGRVLRGSDVLARYGGEEFVLLLPETNLEQGAYIAERLRALVETTSIPTTDGKSLTVTVSVGLASLGASNGAPPHRSVAAMDPVEGRVDDPSAWLLQSADKALYQAKQGGRNRVVCFQPKDRD